jgi:hypothetical protein
VYGHFKRGISLTPSERNPGKFDKKYEMIKRVRHFAPIPCMSA